MWLRPYHRAAEGLLNLSCLLSMKQIDQRSAVKSAEENLSCNFHFIHLFYSDFTLLRGRWRHPRLGHLLLVTCQSRVYFQQYFILPVFPTIPGILPPPVFMKLYIQLSYEKAAAWKRVWITHELTSKFKTASHAKSAQSTGFSPSIHHVGQASVSYHISKLSFVLCNLHRQTKIYIYRSVYREHGQSSQRSISEYCSEMCFVQISCEKQDRRVWMTEVTNTGD